MSQEEQWITINHPNEANRKTQNLNKKIQDNDLGHRKLNIEVAIHETRKTHIFTISLIEYQQFSLADTLEEQ